MFRVALTLCLACSVTVLGLLLGGGYYVTAKSENAQKTKPTCIETGRDSEQCKAAHKKHGLLHLDIRDRQRYAEILRDIAKTGVAKTAEEKKADALARLKAMK